MFNLTIGSTRRLLPLFCFAALFTTNTGAQTVQRNGLAEEFSSSSCHPCKDLYEEYHPATVSIGVNETDSHVNAVHYQINFPLPVDFSYNAHAQQRYDYYPILGLPALKDGFEAITYIQQMLYVAGHSCQVATPDSMRYCQVLHLRPDFTRKMYFSLGLTKK